MRAIEALTLAKRIRKEWAQPKSNSSLAMLAKMGKDLADFVAELDEDECKALLHRIRGE